MADASVEEKVKTIVMDRLSKTSDEVTLEASFIDDLGADSLDQTELLMALEEEFNVDIDDEANTIETVGDAVSYIAVCEPRKPNSSPKEITALAIFLYSRLPIKTSFIFKSLSPSYAAAICPSTVTVLGQSGVIIFL